MAGNTLSRFNHVPSRDTLCRDAIFTCTLNTLSNYVHPSGGWTYYFVFSSVRTLGFRSFEGKVFILSLPNLAWVFIGLIACMGLLLVKIGL